MVDGRTDDGRLDEYTISSPCEPNGSGELIIKLGFTGIYRLIFASKHELWVCLEQK